MSKREFFARTLEYSGMGPFLSLTVGSWNGLVVFNYHRVGDSGNSPFDRGLWSATVDAFDRQVTFLKKHFEIVNVCDLQDLFHHPDDRGVMITFDDGYRDNFELAFPVLRRHGAPATFFITTGFLDDRRTAWWDEIAWMVHTSAQPALCGEGFSAQPLPLATPAARESAILTLLKIYKGLGKELTEDFLNRLAEQAGTGRASRELANSVWMSWDMVRELHAAGMDIGGHTVNHPVLANADAQTQRREIFDSKQRIETEIGSSITAFSYPVGQPESFTLETRHLLHEAGYQWAFSFHGGASLSGLSDRYALPRVAVTPQVSPPLFRSMARLPQLFARSTTRI